MSRFRKFVGAEGFLEPLAPFGQRRLDDALLAAKRSTDAATESATSLPPDSPIRRNRALSEACASEKRASDELREARALIRNARRHWLRASELRADVDSKAGELVLRHDAVAMLRPTGEHQAILEELSSLEQAIDATIAGLGPPLRRLLQGDPFPSTLGLPTAERNAALNEQAMRLFDGGVALDSTSKRLRFHDLRGTGLTRMAIRGDDALKIQQRAGHTTFEMTQKYIRTAKRSVRSSARCSRRWQRAC